MKRTKRNPGGAYRRRRKSSSGVQVTNCGSDQGLAAPMLAAVDQRTGQRPKENLTDG
jgi:hypothetical protein